jgi:hypothetical protein
MAGCHRHARDDCLPAIARRAYASSAGPLLCPPCTCRLPLAPRRSERSLSQAYVAKILGLLGGAGEGFAPLTVRLGA